MLQCFSIVGCFPCYVYTSPSLESHVNEPRGAHREACKGDSGTCYLYRCNPFVGVARGRATGTALLEVHVSLTAAFASGASGRNRPTLFIWGLFVGVAHAHARGATPEGRSLSKANRLQK